MNSIANSIILALFFGYAFTRRAIDNVCWPPLLVEGSFKLDPFMNEDRSMVFIVPVNNPSSNSAPAPIIISGNPQGSGSLIAKNWVVTLADLVFEGCNNLAVAVPTNSILPNLDNANLFTISRTLVSDAYARCNRFADPADVRKCKVERKDKNIALLKTWNPIPETMAVPACLTTDQVLLSNVDPRFELQVALVSGVSTTYGFRKNDYSDKMDINTTVHYFSIKLHQGVLSWVIPDSKRICSETFYEDVSSVRYTGAPVVMLRNSPKQAILIGIAVDVPRCAIEENSVNMPLNSSTYVSVESNLEWITRQLKTFGSIGAPVCLN